MNKQCTKCGEVLPLDSFHRAAGGAHGRRSTCKSCDRTYARDHYHRHPEKKAQYRRDDYQRRKAKGIGKSDERKQRHADYQGVYTAVKRGELVKAPCVICGSTARIHGHHDNYARPLDVVWLCPLHHQERHRAMGAAYV